MRGRCVSERNPPKEKSSVVFGSVRRKSNNFLDTKIIWLPFILKRTSVHTPPYAALF
jgi:hypothetical protein